MGESKSSDAVAGARRRGTGRGRTRAAGAGVPRSAGVAMAAGAAAGGPSSAQAASVSTAAPAAGASGLRGWVGWARGAGLSVSQMVFELHVREGVPLLSVAGALGLSFERVMELWAEVRGEMATRALSSEGEVAALRARLDELLWRTIETTFPVMPLGEEGGVAAPTVAAAPGVVTAPGDAVGVADDEAKDAVASPAAASPAATVMDGMPLVWGVPVPPMLAIRMKAMDLLMKLHGVTPVRSAEDEGDNPQYATPAEIAASVRERMLELWGKE